MDGNGRWAAQRGLPRVKGHEEGAKTVAECMKGCRELQIPYLTLYAFSAENWKRPKHEVDALMGMLEYYLRSKADEMMKNGVRLKVIGRPEDLPPSCRQLIERLVKATEANKGLTLCFALSYGSRREIVDAARSIAGQVLRGELALEDIDEGVFSRNLYTRDLPDPDLLIRTSGEMRISNFLLWQISYAELVVTPTLWPDFKVGHFLEAVKEYRQRKRRFGGV
jgi:undecaprenyl diphosphate synthase